MALRSHDDGSVRVLTMDRPEVRNAFDAAQYARVAEGLRQAGADQSVRAVVLTGSGAAFSSGQDLGELEQLLAGQKVEGGTNFTRLMDALSELPVPIIAAVNGAAVGIGATMLLHCDTVIMASAAKLKFPFAQLGVPTEAAAGALLPLFVGWQRAAELLYTARFVEADEAVALGLALRAVPDATLLEEAVAHARRLTAHSRAGVEAVRRQLVSARSGLVEAAFQREAAAFAALFAQGRGR